MEVKEKKKDDIKRYINLLSSDCEHPYPGNQYYRQFKELLAIHLVAVVRGGAEGQGKIGNKKPTTKSSRATREKLFNLKKLEPLITPRDQALFTLVLARQVLPDTWLKSKKWSQKSMSFYETARKKIKAFRVLDSRDDDLVYSPADDSISDSTAEDEASFASIDQV